ncbi:MAG: T9SS type B sorting domain-containing protein [Nonlabens sp.]
MVRLLVFFLVFVLGSAFAKAQLGFCTGQTGSIVFEEDFGTGTTNGPPLPTSVTTYRYVNSGVQDGEYTISSNMMQLGSFFNASDRTPNDTNGRMLIVNADFNEGVFYQTPITGLCENTPYEFSAWVINVFDSSTGACTGPGEVPIQVRFEIWNASDTALLSSGVMPPRQGETTPDWRQYGLTFTTDPGQNGCILKLINDAPGGCGNDLAIDDIQFRTCGDIVTIVDNASNTEILFCENDVVSNVNINAITGAAIFATPEYQWQESNDGVNFTDIPGENGSSIVTPILSASTFYRVKIVEDAVNFNNLQCVNFSQVYEIRFIVVPVATPEQATYLICENDTISIAVMSQTGLTHDWYDAANGGTLLESDTDSIEVSAAGTFYVEARSIDTGCVASVRERIEVLQDMPPAQSNFEFEVCEGDSLLLDPMFTGISYNWSTMEITPTITINETGLYSVEIETSTGCVFVIEFNVQPLPVPVITDVDVDRNPIEIEVEMENENFTYSFNNSSFQSSRLFFETVLPRNVARARSADGCSTVEFVFLDLQVPEFFTPNGDGFNDLFELPGQQNYPGYTLDIFDRNGKFIKRLDIDNIFWNGMLDNNPLPSSDYWYIFKHETIEQRGHFTLKR